MLFRPPWLFILAALTTSSWLLFVPKFNNIAPAPSPTEAVERFMRTHNLTWDEPAKVPESPWGRMLKNVMLPLAFMILCAGALAILAKRYISNTPRPPLLRTWLALTATLFLLWFIHNLGNVITHFNIDWIAMGMGMVIQISALIACCAALASSHYNYRASLQATAQSWALGAIAASTLCAIRYYQSALPIAIHYSSITEPGEPLIYTVLAYFILAGVFFTIPAVLDGIATYLPRIIHYPLWWLCCAGAAYPFVHFFFCDYLVTINPIWSGTWITALIATAYVAMYATSRMLAQTFVIPFVTLLLIGYTIQYAHPGVPYQLAISVLYIGIISGVWLYSLQKTGIGAPR